MTCRWNNGGATIRHSPSQLRCAERVQFVGDFSETERVKVLVPVRIVMRDGIGVTDAAVGGCGAALPIDISVRHLFRSGALRAAA